MLRLSDNLWRRQIAQNNDDVAKIQAHIQLIEDGMEQIRRLELAAGRKAASTAVY